MSVLRFDRSDTPIEGATYVVGMTKRNQAICWASHVDYEVLHAMYGEADRMGLERPLLVFGHVCTVGRGAGKPTFHFKQVSGSVTGFEWEQD